jgi:hypothetical protein
MYNSLESHVFDSYLQRSPSQFAGCDDSGEDYDTWLSLYNWTRNTYLFFSKKPELLIKQLHDDCDLPGIFGTYSTLQNGAKIKTALRKAIAAMNSLLQFVWETTLVSECNDNLLVLPEDYIISKKYMTLLNYTGIEIIDNCLIANDYSGMFSALKELTKHTDGFAPPWNYRNEPYSHQLSIYANGFRRFIRCIYDKNSISLVDLFGGLSGDIDAFNRLIGWLKDNNYQQGLCLDTSNFESSGISFKKNVTGNNISNDNLLLYDHDHIGFRAEYCVIRTPRQSFHLTIQNPRDILSSFEVLPPIVQKFIINYHAKCWNCGYCTQRSNGKCKPYTMIVKFESKSYPFCPINHLYSYCWNTLTNELVDGLIAYLEYIQNMDFRC